MASDPSKPLLRLTPQPEQDRLVGKRRSIPKPSGFPRDRQIGAFSPKFDRLADVLNRDPTGLELRADPAGLAPERLLVFEVRGSISAFAAAVRNVPGLELIDEEELEADEEDKAPVAYLMVPDVRALRDLESLRRRWLDGRLVYGETPWRDVFSLLRDLRPWGPADRVQPGESDILSEEISDLGEDDAVRLEIELVYRANADVGAECEAELRAAVTAQAGRIISASRIGDSLITHSWPICLFALSVRSLRALLTALLASGRCCTSAPRASASTIDVTDATKSEGPLGGGDGLRDPILALLDGVPVAAHRLLAAHVVVDDQVRTGTDYPSCRSGAWHGHGLADPCTVIAIAMNLPCPDKCISCRFSALATGLRLIG